MKMVLVDWVANCYDERINLFFDVLGPPAGPWVLFVKLQQQSARDVYYPIQRGLR
ncbi:MAG: hypothetical protein ACXADB_07870 [Candidatus Hermodarchaeia archaeon]|jgi:hypothetical protein